MSIFVCMPCNEEMQLIDNIYNSLRVPLPLFNALFNNSRALSSSRPTNSKGSISRDNGLNEVREEEEEEEEEEDINLGCARVECSFSIGFSCLASTFRPAAIDASVSAADFRSSVGHCCSLIAETKP